MWKNKQGIERRSRRYLLHLLVSSDAASLFERSQHFRTRAAATSQIRATVSLDGTGKPAANQDKFDRVTTVLIGKGRGGVACRRRVRPSVRSSLFTTGRE